MPPLALFLPLWVPPMLLAGISWPTTTGEWILWLIASAAALEKLWGWIFGGAGERLKKLEASIGQFVDKDALEKRFGDIEGKAKLQAADLLNQHNTLHEYERERERLAGEFRAGINQLKKDVAALEAMPGRVTQLETKLDNLSTQIADLKTGQRELRQEMKNDLKENKGEILAAIRDLKTTH